MELAYIVNNEIGGANLHQVRIGSLAASSLSNDVLNTDAATVIDYLEFATDSKDKVRIFIIDKSSTDNVATGISTNGASLLTSARPNNLVNIGSWEVLAYNETTNNYKFVFRLRGQIFTKGVRIYVENQDTDAHNAGVMVLARTL